jgi:hypothetical protein
MRKTMSTSPQPDSDSYIAKMMLLKTYNKLDSLREVGVPEAISHLLKFPNHSTDTTFVNIYMTHVLRHMYDLAQHQDMEEIMNVEDDEFDSEIVVTDGGFCIVSLFDDYAYRGPELTEYCLYDYCPQFYKRKKLSGLSFDTHHPQHTYYSQFLRKNDSVTVPTLPGEVLFVKQDSEDEKKREDYYCLIALTFFRWFHRRTQPRKAEDAQLRILKHNVINANIPA